MDQATTTQRGTPVTACLTEAPDTALSRSVAVALRQPARAIRTAPSAEPLRLTPREREVAALITKGLPGHRIAATMTISARTAGIHVRLIMIRLGFTMRSDRRLAGQSGRHLARMPLVINHLFRERWPAR
jgi:non-specific serine/threonine protein kinase